MCRPPASIVHARVATGLPIVALDGLVVLGAEHAAFGLHHHQRFDLAPIVKLDGGKSNVIRIVRTAKAPVQGEESYRLIVDELPPAKGGAGLSIKFVLRYSIPVFFNSAQQKGADLSWSVSTKGGQTVLTAANTGDSHLRISGLSMTPAGGKTVSFGQGLVGYVLAKSTARFTLKQALKGARAGSTVEIMAEGNDGPVKATAEVRAAN